MFNIYMGWDPREIIAFDVARFSIQRRSTKPVTVHSLRLPKLRNILTRPIERRANQLWCPISNAPMATEFAISRFCVQFLQKNGWALFVDCDILALADITNLFDLADSKYAVMTVKHKQEGGADKKMDGQQQTYYQRKNWSSVMLWNCGHPSNRKLTLEMINTLPGRDLHRFCWLADEEIGALPNEWNWLVGIDKKDVVEPKLLHYTLGGPWFEAHKDTEYAGVWNKELDIFRRSI